MATEPARDLLRNFVHGDRAAFEALFRAFEHEVHRWILRIVRDPSIAEDGVIEAFWRCYRSRARFDPSRSFGAWMRRIATHVAIDLLASARRHDSVALGERAEPPCAHGDETVDNAIARAFESLPPKLKAVATLALIEQCPHGEIAEALGVPIGTVKSRLFRATQRLRKALTEVGP